MTTITDQPMQTLLELVQQHKLDPWDVDLEKLTHVYSVRMNGMKEVDLRSSGRTLLSASVLLRIKSNYILNGNGNGRAVEEDMDEILDVNLPDFGEITFVQNTPRKIMLSDLLGALQEALSEIPVKKVPLSKRMGKLTQLLSEYDVNIEKHIEAMYRRLQGIIAPGTKVTMISLLEERTRIALARTLLLLLFLCSEGRIVLEQPSLFSDIMVSFPGKVVKDGS